MIAVAAAGMVASYERSNFYPDLRDPFAAIASAYRPQDVVELSGYPASHRAGDYYVTRLRRRRPAAIVVDAPAGQLAGPPLAPPARVWIVSDPVTAPSPVARSALTQLGYRVLELRRFVPGAELGLAVDARARGAP